MTNVVSITSGTRSVEAREIQVSGHEIFSAHEWKEAFAYYLDGVRTNAEHVMYRPKIFFGNVTLRRMKDAYAVEGRGVSTDVPKCDASALLTTTNAHFLVEEALRYFVKHEKTKVLCIEFQDDTKLFIWKMEDGTYDTSLIRPTPDS
jgi:hypothetical protein